MKKNSLAVLKIVGGLTFFTGGSLHVVSLIVSRDYFFENILTSTTDTVLSIPMLLAAIFVWFALPTIDFKGIWQKIIYLIMSIYITISVPIHIKSWFTSDLDQIKFFPKEYSYFIIPVIYSLLIFILTLKKKESKL